MNVLRILTRSARLILNIGQNHGVFVTEVSLPVIYIYINTYRTMNEISYRFLRWLI
jgi:hypothetical protein